jgi:GT2 family glycosyltransferase
MKGNDWSQLLPPADERWTPHRPVSICIPTRNPGPGLRRTLLALTAQSYPHRLFEVVIADDGSVPPVTIPSSLPYECRVVRQEQTLAFGAGQARNTAARAAGGEILVFLDGDVIPERQVLSAYARWFDRSDLVVPMGLCNFVDTDDLADDQLVRLVADGAMADHFAGSEVDDQAYRETTFQRTHDLRVEAIDAFRITIGATLAVTSAQFAEVGGFRELGVRGVEDTEFGYRLHTNGAILVLDRDAIHWHQGRRNLTSERRAEIERIRRPYVEALIPLPGFRRSDAFPVGDIDVVPAFRVITPEEPVLTDGFDPSFATAVVPVGLEWTSQAERAVRTIFREHPVGVVRALCASDPAAPVVVVRNRAVRRARHVRPDEDPITVASELFGSWWVDAESLGIVPVTSETVAEDAGPHEGPSAHDVLSPSNGGRRGRLSAVTRRFIANWAGATLDVLRRWAG